MALNGGNIGAMDTRITIQEPTDSRDSVSNERVTTWSDFATVWGEFKPLARSAGDLSTPAESRSTELYEADQQVIKRNYRIKIRYLEGVDETMRINVDGEISYISGIEKWGRKSYLVLYTETRDA